MAYKELKMSRGTFYSLSWYEFFCAIGEPEGVVSDSERQHIKEKAKEAWAFFRRPSLN